MFIQAPPSQNGAVDSKDTANGHIPANDRCITPVIPDIMDPSLCYLPNSYQHAAYYYGGKQTPPPKKTPKNKKEKQSFQLVIPSSVYLALFKENNSCCRLQRDRQ